MLFIIHLCQQWLCNTVWTHTAATNAVLALNALSMFLWVSQITAETIAVIVNHSTTTHFESNFHHQDFPWLLSQMLMKCRLTGGAFDANLWNDKQSVTSALKSENTRIDRFKCKIWNWNHLVHNVEQSKFKVHLNFFIIHRSQWLKWEWRTMFICFEASNWHT